MFGIHVGKYLCVSRLLERNIYDILLEPCRLELRLNVGKVGAMFSNATGLPNYHLVI
jgi:hypothetical protein